MAYKYVQDFTVEGFMEFPADMLRYDHCWPYDSASASEVTAKAERNHAGLLEKRTVQLTRHVDTTKRLPTFDRWKSFGWLVLPDSINTRKLQ